MLASSLASPSNCMSTRRVIRADGFGIIEPPAAAMSDVLAWMTDDKGEQRLVPIGAWVICTGFQADAPQRAALNRNVGTGAEKGCDFCTLKGKQGGYNAVKFLGCVH